MSTIQFEYDPERLIEEVQKRPGIWDFEDVQYRTKKVRHRLWTEVVKELMDGDVKVSKSEMRELELQLQKKWKSIRDCHQKYLKDPNRTKRPYLYSKHLMFLHKNQNLLANVNENTVTSESDEGQEKRKIWKPRKKLKWVRASQVSSDDDTMQDDNDTFNTQDTGSPEDIEIELTPSAKNISANDEFAFASVDNNLAQKSEAEDCDKLFLLSLLPHLKSIPEEYRLNVKVDLMQVLRNANFHASRDMKMM